MSCMKYGHLFQHRYDTLYKYRECMYVCMYVICTNNYIKQGQVYRGGAGRAIAPPPPLSFYLYENVFENYKKINFCKFFT